MANPAVIKSGRSYFGVETVLREELREDFDRTSRWVVTDRWLVSDVGVEEHEANLTRRAWETRAVSGIICANQKANYELFNT